MYCFVFDLNTFMKLRYRMKYINSYKFYKIIAVNQHNLGKMGRVKFIHMAVDREGFYIYTLFPVNAPITRMVYKI